MTLEGYGAGPNMSRLPGSVLVPARGFHPQKQVSRPALQSNSGDYSVWTHLAYPLQPGSGQHGEELAFTYSGGPTGRSVGIGACGRGVSGTLLR